MKTKTKTTKEEKGTTKASFPKKEKHMRLLWSKEGDNGFGVRASAGSLIFAHMIGRAGKWVSLKELDRYRLPGQAPSFVDHRLAKFNRLLSAGSGPKAKKLYCSAHLEYSADGQQARFVFDKEHKDRLAGNKGAGEAARALTSS